MLDPQGSGHPGYPNPDHVPAMGTFFRAPEVQPPIIPPDWNPLIPDVESSSSAVPPAVSASMAPPAMSAPPQPAPSEPEPAVAYARTNEAPKASVDGSAIDILRAFLEGAGLSPPDPKTVDVAVRMRGYGEIMRELVAGIRELLAVRTLTKSEFRIEQTMIQPVGNNPLKFSVDLEQALSALLLPQRSGYAEPLPAAREAIADLKSHELSVIAGMQKSIAKLLAGLAPDEIERRVESTGLLASLLPAARKARYWEAYENIYQRLVEECREDMRSSVRQAFAEAYFDQAKKL
jgi:type VI secretion system FHA domain protein